MNDIAYGRKYTNTLQLDYDCNYLNPEESNSSDFILSCINKPNIKNPMDYGMCLNPSIDLQNEDMVEGFSNDNSTNGPGVSYTPKGTCHDGYTRDKDGECNIQLFRGRVRDGAWQRGHHNETMHHGKENLNLCGNNTFRGLSNGYLVCDEQKNKQGEDEEGEKNSNQIPLTYELFTLETFSNV